MTSLSTSSSSSNSSSASLADIPIDTLYTLLAPVTIPAHAPRARFTNWGKTFTCVPLAVFEPETEHQCDLILELARRENKTVRATGVGHSPSDLGCTSGFMIRMEKLDRLLEVNVEKQFVVVQPGVKLYVLHERLAEHGLAMINVGSISEQTLAGCITTATHGSGITFGSMSTQVQAFTLLLADGSHVRCSPQENADLFFATLCGLGSTGIVLTLQLQVEPSFHLKEVQDMVDFDDIICNLETFVESAQHVRMWWFPQNGSVRTSYANRSQESINPAGSWLWNSLMAHHLVQFLLFLGRYFLFINTWTARFTSWVISKPTVSVDISHRIFNVDCRYPQHTTEWAVPYSNARACLLELRVWLDEELANPKGLRPHFPVEIRFSEADGIWLSPGYGRRTCWIGIVQYKPYDFNVPYRTLFRRYEEIVLRHGGRPHWAKAHGFRPDGLRALYPRFDDFVRLLERVDPRGMFRNEYVRRHIFGQDVDERVFKQRA